MLRSRSDGCHCLLMGSQHHTVPQKAGKSRLKPREHNWCQTAVQSAGGIYRGPSCRLESLLEKPSNPCESKGRISWPSRRQMFQRCDVPRVCVP